MARLFKLRNIPSSVFPLSIKRRSLRRSFCEMPLHPGGFSPFSICCILRYSWSGTTAAKRIFSIWARLSWRCRPGPAASLFSPGRFFCCGKVGKPRLKYFGDAIVGQAWFGFLAKKISGRGANAATLPGSFVVKAPETSRYLKIPYLIYFFCRFCSRCRHHSFWTGYARGMYLLYRNVFPLRLSKPVRERPFRLALQACEF